MKIIQFVLLLTLFSCSDRTPQENNRALESEIKSEAQDWKSEVAETLKLFGHRNWIVVADGAYPQQSNPAIKTITIIRDLDAAAKLFNVLIIKTDLAIPYTSVFYQLECGYWNAAAEERLRKEIHK